MGRLPSIFALLALEAAARHQSFVKAAQKLSLSEGAISRQIAKLETFLGIRLFHRVGNRVELSAHSAGYASQIRSSLADIEWHTLQLIADSRGLISLEVGVIPTLVSRWLTPRLTRFQEKHPEIDIHTSAKRHSLSHWRKLACLRSAFSRF